MDDLKIKKRVTKDTVEINGRTFEINKFDPLLGNYIILKVMGFVLPMGMDEKLTSGIGGFAAAVANISRANMPKEDFIDLQKDILSVAYEVLPGDKPPILRENGTYGIVDFTAPLALQLMIRIIAFNFTDFFGASGLNEIMNQGSDGSPQNTQTSTQEFTSL